MATLEDEGMSVLLDVQDIRSKVQMDKKFLDQTGQEQHPEGGRGIKVGTARKKENAMYDLMRNNLRACYSNTIKQI